MKQKVAQAEACAIHCTGLKPGAMDGGHKLCKWITEPPGLSPVQ